MFITLVEEMLLQDPDLETAQFEILDFSATNSKAHRQLKIIDTTYVPRLDTARKEEMLSVFVEGYQRAEAKLLTANQPRKRKETESIDDINQMPLWDL